MCIAVPGKLIEINGRRGRADVRGTVLTVELGLVDAKLGDYILVHAGCAISVVSKEESDELNELLELIQYGEH
ncbi:MAG TPA: HypC/HybG/HupF family hydrogenase formation chaperone [Feifaniaceae bacterium]|nr:HypC/HybG/HupF family hydrogenase formation chaperone [Feifaniaceae bacterium]